MRKSEALKQRRRLLKLIEKWTRAEIMSRLGHATMSEACDYFQKKLDLEDEIREFLFGTSDFVVLGVRWNLVMDPNEKKKKKKRKDEE